MHLYLGVLDLKRFGSILLRLAHRTAIGSKDNALNHLIAVAKTNHKYPDTGGKGRKSLPFEVLMKTNHMSKTDAQ